MTNQHVTPVAMTSPDAMMMPSVMPHSNPKSLNRNVTSQHVPMDFRLKQGPDIKAEPYREHSGRVFPEQQPERELTLRDEQQCHSPDSTSSPTNAAITKESLLASPTLGNHSPVNHTKLNSIFSVENLTKPALVRDRNQNHVVPEQMETSSGQTPKPGQTKPTPNSPNLERGE
jgi:hypothetical protein